MKQLASLSPAVAKHLRYYVYLYVNPLDGKVFYVGKGKGRRAFAHLDDADKKRVRRVIRQIRAARDEPQIEILAHGLRDEKTALAIEAAAIDLLGIETLANRVRGHGSRLGRMAVDDLAAHYTRKTVRITEPSVLIRINRAYRFGITPAELYDATRSAWVVGEKREVVELAFAVFKGVIREVYRVTHWFPAGSTFNTRLNGRAVRRSRRWEFVGVVAEDGVRDKYLGRYVGDLLKPGNQNPIAYVNVR